MELKVDAWPVLMSVAEAVKRTGLSRTEVYSRLKAGEIKGRKMRNSTLIETASLVAVIESLPAY